MCAILESLLPLVVPEVVVLIFFCPDVAFVAYRATLYAGSFSIVAGILQWSMGRFPCTMEPVFIIIPEILYKIAVDLRIRRDSIHNSGRGIRI